VSRALLEVGAALLAALLLHHGLGRAGRRLPHVLARRRGADRGPDVPGRRAFALAALAAQAALWGGLAWLAMGRVPLLAEGRDAALRLVGRALTMPLFTLDAKGYTALDLLTLPALLAGVWLGASGAVRALRGRVLAAVGVEGGLSETLSVLLRYALAFLGSIVVLQAWGVDLRSVAILASVVGVGIGFGLQNIANNFVSGLLINFGRPIRPGDFVNVGAHAGTVVRVGARSTAIRTLDEVTILVPNSRFLESEVVNWSHEDPLTRVHVPVGVAYGSDVERVRRALLEAARGHPAVLREPRPQVQLRRFGESSLDFELLVWTCDPRGQQSLVSDLNFRIEAGLRRHGVQIPFPQRDLHLRSPALERWLGALGGRLGLEGAEAGGEGAPAGTGRANGEPPSPEPHDASPEDWDAARVAEVVTRMRGPGGVAIADRRHRLSVYPRSFVGHEAVEWLVAREGLTHAEAVRFGQQLVEAGLVHHVLDEHDFRDEHLFYRFRADD
jgi:small-conductance mechanosensitive channel